MYLAHFLYWQSLKNETNLGKNSNLRSESECPNKCFNFNISFKAEVSIHYSYRKEVGNSNTSWLEEHLNPRSTWWTKEWLKMKMTKLWVGYFMIISCHFFANYINKFYKTEELKVVLVYPIYKNINWIKSYDINNNFCFVSVFSIL